MTTKPKPRRKLKPPPPVDYFSYQLRQPAIDLFGEVAVIEDDLYDWVASVAPLHLSPRAFANYVRGYDVAAKVRHAKLHGLFDAIKERPSRPWHARLAMHAIM
ncbi:hypothetical protein [Janthinobacterium sp. LB3P118]|uniref:hypothetical protein n=1 Tax=Janthinobacterium sp. LB3P118 TaxID=3424195 RepID=UPI003F272382